MTSPTDVRSHDRFKLVTAGHHFLLNVIPLRQPDSLAALDHFLWTVRNCRLPWPDIDAILIRTLSVLDAHTQRRIPTLVERYCSATSTPTASLAAFAVAIQDMVRYANVTDGSVQQAMEVVRQRYHDPRLKPDVVAALVGVRLPTLDVAFRRHLGCTITEYIRNHRMEVAAELLVTKSDTIKEIWAAVGYNHASNFDHDFKRHLKMSPSEFRARAIRPIAQRHYTQSRLMPTGPRQQTTDSRTSVLLVDDDESTLELLGLYLQDEGYDVVVAATGGEGLRTVKSFGPRAILLDYHLPDMTGLQFLRTLRTDQPDDALPVALFSADWDLFDQTDEASQLGALIVSKLCDVEQVTRVISYLAADDTSRLERSPGETEMPPNRSVDG